MHGVDYDSDHVPVVSAMEIKIKKKKREESKNDTSVSVKNTFSAMGLLVAAEERWQMVEESMLESAKEHILFTKRKKTKNWMTPQNFRPNGREKESQARRAEIQKTIQTSEKEIQ